MNMKSLNTNPLFSKLLTASCMILIFIFLYTTCYMWFFRTIEMDITKDVKIQYEGESGNAKAIVVNSVLEIDQRKKEFYDSIEYTIKPNKNLKNGDRIKVYAKYDDSLATRYHIQVARTVRSIEVSGLPVRLANAQAINQKFLDATKTKGEKYLQKHMQEIMDNNFNDFHIDANAVFNEQKLLYRAFLNAHNNENTDRIVDIYEIKAEGNVNVSKGDEKIERKESTIYYMITYNGVNSSFEIKDENIFGEKLILNKNYNLMKEKDMLKFLNKKYHKAYDITILED